MLSILLLGLSFQTGIVLGLSPGSSSSIFSKSGYVLPQFDPNPLERSQEVAINHAGFLYGPPLIGNSSYFPGGALGNQRVHSDIVAFLENSAFINQSIHDESGAVKDRITKVSGMYPATFLQAANNE